MKTFFLFLALLAFSIAPSWAQTPITLTSSTLLNLFGAGKSQKSISAGDTTSGTMNVGTAETSSAQSWTLPSVTFVDTSVSVNQAPSSTPFGGDFPSATNATVSSVSDSSGTISVTSYFRIVPDSFLTLGGTESVHEGAFDTTFVKKTNTLIALLPIVLGTVTKSADTLSTGASSSEIQTTTSTFDAYGSITIPGGTFSCLRETNVLVIQFVGSGGSIPNDTLISFTWYTGEGHQANVSAKFNNQTSGSIPVKNINFTEVVNTAVFVAEKPAGVVSTFSLAQNYPNPFNPSTNISYTVPSHQFVSLQVYDVLGRKVATLVNETKDAGTYSVRFDASSLPSGVYLYRLQAGSYSETKKLLLMK